jgi:hypothetical protein
MSLILNETTLLMVLVIILVIFYSSNALSSPEGSVKKYVYKKKQLGSVVGDHGGLLVSSPEINIRTRGPDMNYQQQGILYKDDGGVLGLYGRQKYPGSSQWEYLVKDKSLDDIKIPLDEKRELDDDDTVSVKGFGDGYKVQLYDNQELRYLPY